MNFGIIKLCHLYGDGCVTGGRHGLQIRTTLVISVTLPKIPCVQLKCSLKMMGHFFQKSVVLYSDEEVSELQFLRKQLWV